MNEDYNEDEVLNEENGYYSDVEGIEEHHESGYQPLKNAKKTAIATTCLTLAGLIAAGFVGAYALKKLRKPVNPEPITTLTETEPETEVEIDHGNLILWEDFDINNKDEVRQRAQAIYDISEKKYSVDEIVNIIYYFNEKYDNITFKSDASSEDKFKYLQNLAIHLSDLLDDNLKDDLDRMYSLLDKDNGEDTVLSKDDHEIYAYMFMPSNTKVVTETMTGEKVEFNLGNKGDKDIAIALALEVEKQLDAIKDGNTSSFSNNAKNFFVIVEQIGNLKDTPDGYMVLMIDDYKTKYPLYGNNFTKEQQEVLNETTQNNYLNTIGFAAAKATGASFDARKHKGQEITPQTEKYVAADKKKAEEGQTTVTFSEKKVIEQGGKKVETSSKQTIVTPGTTKVETFTFLASTTKSDTTFTTIYEPGGLLVSESEVYVDADAKDAEKYATEVVEESTTKFDEQNITTTKFVDSETTTLIVLDEGGQKVLS